MSKCYVVTKRWGVENYNEVPIMVFNYKIQAIHFAAKLSMELEEAQVKYSREMYETNDENKIFRKIKEEYPIVYPYLMCNKFDFVEQHRFAIWDCEKFEGGD